MAFTVADFHDLVTLLDKNPDWQRELRRLILSDELLALPAEFHALAAAEAHVDERLASMLATHERIEQQLLAAAANADARFAELRANDQRLADQLTDVKARSDEQFAELRAADQRLADQLSAAQARSDEQFAAAQARSDEQFAAAQARSDEQFAAAQTRSDEQFAELRAADQRLADQLSAAQARSDEQFAAAQARSDEQFAAAQARSDEQFAAAQARSDEQFAAAQARSDEQFAAAQARSDEQVAELHAADQRLEGRLDELASEFHDFRRHTENRLANLDGASLEQQFAMRAPAHLGNLSLRRARVLPTAEWVSKVEDAVDAGLLNENEGSDVRNLDAVVHAQDAAGDVWLAVELSVTVDVHDVDRAVRRASLLTRALGRARPLVAGQRLTEGAKRRLASIPDSLCVAWPASR